MNRKKNIIKLVISNLFLIAISFLFSVDSFSQCPDGAIGVSGAGCGCAGGCDLTSFGGPNCGGGSTGNCTAGYIPIQVDIVVPDGCVFTVTAVMENRPGCTASGADGNCITCDRLKVDIPGGPKPFQIGGGNASITDSYTLAGPATIRVSGAANRADEIITYTTTFSGPLCVACASILPIDLWNFNAEFNDKFVELTWITESETNNDFFTVERSTDAVNFEPISTLQAAGNSSSRISYKIYDSSPPDKTIVYYRLKQTDLDGNFTYTNIVSVFIKTSPITCFTNGQLRFNLENNSAKSHLVTIYNMQGQLIFSTSINNEFELFDWPYHGVFLVVFPELGVSEKLMTP